MAVRSPNTPCRCCAWCGSTGGCEADMSTPLPFRAARAVRLATHTTLTRLPFGGAVLINGVTLELAECSESDADIVDRLLTRGLGLHSVGPVVRLAEQMIRAGWLLTVPMSDQ